MATMVNFHAHPDDEAIATSGTMMKAVADGHRVVLVLATRGEQGEPVPGVLAPGETLGERRELETLESARIIGAHRVEFLGYEDSGMNGEPTNENPACFWQADFEEAVGRLQRVLLEESADVLTVYDEHGGYGHPDHIQVHRVGVAAAARAGVPRVYYATMNRTRVLRRMQEQPDAMDVEAFERLEAEGFGMAEEELTHAVDVTGTMDRKRATLLVHASQIDPDSFFVSMAEEEFREAFGTEWYAAHGIPPDGSLRGDLFA